MRYINEVIMHCTATREGVAVDASQVDEWHLERGFKKIGYHYLIGLDGSIEVGRHLDEIGAHCAQHNSHSIGIAYVGGLDSESKPKDTRTFDQKESLERLIKSLIIVIPSINKIVGHDYYNSNKACPCFDVKKEYENILKKY